MYRGGKPATLAPSQFPARRESKMSHTLSPFSPICTASPPLENVLLFTRIFIRETQEEKINTGE